MKYFFCFFTAVLMLWQTAYSQEDDAANLPEIDSILNLIARETDDEEIAKLYNSIVHIPSASSNQRIKYAHLSLEHCHKNNLKLIADNYNYISYSYNNLGNPQKSLEYCRPLLELYKKLKMPERVAVIYSRLAINYEYLNLPDSIFHYHNKALQVYEDLNDTLNIANSYCEIAASNADLSFYKTAEEYFRKAFAMDSAIGNKIGMARDYSGIGLVVSEYFIPNDYSKIKSGITFLKIAADGFEKAKIDKDDIQNIIYEYMTFSHLANAYIKYAEVGGRDYADSCLLYLNKIGSFFEDIEYNGMVWQNQYVLVKHLIYNQKYDEALRIMLDLETKLDNGELDREISSFYYELYLLYIKQGDYQNACIALRKHYEKRLTEVNDNALASAANAKTEQALMYERKITTAEKQKMRIAISSLILGLILVLVVIGLIIRVLILKKRANAELLEKNAILSEQKEEISAQRDEIEAQRDEIEAQRDHIEEQSKEIQASINYARRIQRSMLPPNETITHIFPDHFLLYKPRDIVSGDYYWVGQFGDNKICIVADCTGHGVPGGFLSVLGMSNLNYIVGQDVCPDVILNRLREAIISNLRQRDNSPSALQEEEDSVSDFFRSSDGMDAVVYIVNERQMTLTFAGANNPLVLIRGDEIQVLKGDRMPVGIYARLNPFQSTTIDIQKGDCIYTFSDGFQDQFEDGGVNNKFSARRLRQLLLEIHQQPMAEQKEILNRTFEQWRGPADNQTDDVVIMGVRI